MATAEHSADLGRERKARVEVFPRIITVSREFAAGGARVSLRVAAELGYQLWDHELVAHLARKADVDLLAMREVDERERALYDEVFAASLRGRVSGSKYRTLLTHTVSDLAERGAAVVVGRGANFLVDAEHALRVRIICPRKQRIERYAAAAGCDYATAERYVADKDRERDRFVRQLCGEHTSDPAHYDLVVNTNGLSEECAARLVINAYRARFGTATKSSIARDEASTPAQL